MNPLADSSNRLTGNELQQAIKSGYTPGYTGIANRDLEAATDPELLRLIELWPQLPEHLRKTIRTLFDAAGLR